MFIPRSLSKHAPKPVTSQKITTASSSVPSASTSAPQPSSSNLKKRNIQIDENESSGETSSEDDSDENSSSNSDSEFDSESNDDDKQPTSAVTKESKPKHSPGATNRQEQIQSEIAARLELALSDVSLWRNETLFRRLTETQDWYIPFSRLHDHPLLAPFLSGGHTRVPDAALVNALRTYGSGSFEPRIKIRAPSNAAWKNKSQSSGWVGAAGGYEIRCKAWASRAEGWMDELAALDEYAWHGRMVYVEHVPSTIPSLWGLYHFITALARGCHTEDGDPPSQIVQDVFIPTAEPTVADHPPEATRRFRGQAFVVFSTENIARAFCKRWVWNPPREARGPDGSADQGGGTWSTETAVAAATFSSFRSISKARWNKLKSEYLEHQARVLRHAPKKRQPPINSGESPSYEPPEPKAFIHPPKSTQTTYPPAFPPGILVFVRRLHPETNKTTLKTLFSRAFRDGPGDAIEYLDFQKGVNSAHIRLRTPSDASTLAAYFSAHPVVQKDGLDAEGKSCKKDDAIEAEVVLGTREANYWEKVPEKIRMAAVAKAGLGGSNDANSGAGGRRKRQRKG